MIEFRNVKYNYKNIDVVSNLNFTIRDKSVTCLIGYKNSGKSTILKIIAGINKDYYGDILINGKYLEDENDVKIAFVQDKMEENTDLNVRQYLMFYCSLHNIDKIKADEYIDKMLAEFGILSYKYTDMSLLDIETLKLIDIIRAFINNPDVILFDNLFFSQDNEYNLKLLEFIKTLVGKKTLIFASRYLKYLDEICDDIGVINNGSMDIFGNKDEIFTSYELKRRIQVTIYDGVEKAIDLLKNEENVSNISFDDKKILFSVDGDVITENAILKKLIDNDIKIFSYRKESVAFEDLYNLVAK